MPADKPSPAEPNWWDRNAVYFSGTFQIVGGVVEMGIGGAAMFVPGLQVPGGILIGLGLDQTVAGVRTNVAGEHRDTGLTQTVGKVAEQLGATEYEGLAYGRSVDGLTHLGVGFGVASGLQTARLASESAEAAQTATATVAGESAIVEGGLPSKIAEGYGIAAEEAAEARAGVVDPSSVVDPNKFKYVFGEVTSGTHNTQRSLQNAAQMNRIGIHNTAEGQKYLTQHLQRVAQDPSSVARTFQKTLPDGSTITLEVRESLLSGPGGFLKLESTWEILADGTRRLSTIIPFGG